MRNDTTKHRIAALFEELNWGAITTLSISEVGLLQIRWASELSDPLAALMANADGQGAPYVLDPDDGVLCRRLTLVPAVWMNHDRLRAQLTSKPIREDKNRLLEQLGEHLDHGRLRLRAGATWWSLCCKIWPPLYRSRPVHPDRLHHLARMLLLRAGANSLDYFQIPTRSEYDLLAPLERCLPLVDKVETSRIPHQVRRLFQDTAEDRRILDLLLQREAPPACRAVLDVG